MQILNGILDLFKNLNKRDGKAGIPKKRQKPDYDNEKYLT